MMTMMLMMMTTMMMMLMLMKIRCGTVAPLVPLIGCFSARDISPNLTSPGTYHQNNHDHQNHHDHQKHHDHHDLPWCGNYGGLAPTSALLPDDHRHHCYPNHDYLDDPDHDYLDSPWCGNYGGLTPTSLSSFLASVGPQVRLK